MKLLLFNLATDADDPILGFTIRWIEALAARCEQIDVITMRAGRMELPDNVRVFSLGKEWGYSETRRLLRLYRLLFACCFTRRYDAAFFHMTPLFAALCAPVLRVFGVRSTLWYAHRSVTRKLKIAERVVARVVTPSEESFRLPSHKKVVTGHGVDTAQFTPQPRAADGKFVMAAIGRITPVKGIDSMIKALALLHGRGMTDVRLRLVGPVLEGDEAYAAEMRELAAQSDISAAVEWAGAVPHEKIADVYHNADAALNISGSTSIDKTALEAMACGVPVFAGNDSMRAMFAGWADVLICTDAGSLAANIAAWHAMPLEAREVLTARLREIVVREHSLERLADLLMTLFRERR